MTTPGTVYYPPLSKNIPTIAYRVTSLVVTKGRDSYLCSSRSHPHPPLPHHHHFCRIHFSTIYIKHYVTCLRKITDVLNPIGMSTGSQGTKPPCTPSLLLPPLLPRYPYTNRWKNQKNSEKTPRESHKSDLRLLTTSFSRLPVQNKPKCPQFLD